MTPFFDKAGFLAALHALPQPDHDAIAGAQARQHSLTKPAGSLGRLEEIAIFMAGWQGASGPCWTGCKRWFLPAIMAWRRAGQRLSHRRHRPDGGQFYHGGAAINALARACGADLHVVPLDLDRPTGDITIEAAMSGDECLAALNAGARAVGESDLLIVGEMGIGNTTPAAALCAQAFGGSAREWVGRGTGIDDAAIARKYAAVDGALALHGAACTDPFEALRRLGGREIAAMAGAIVAARLAHIPVLLDGFICCAALAPLVAARPQITRHCLAAHCSAEAGHRRLLAAMQPRSVAASGPAPWRGQRRGGGGSGGAQRAGRPRPHGHLEQAAVAGRL
jgi:nicotinate-nucleotide--dimethylbenzimidazole phosphoribosyltransferase